MFSKGVKFVKNSLGWGKGKLEPPKLPYINGTCATSDITCAGLYNFFSFQQITQKLFKYADCKFFLRKQFQRISDNYLMVVKSLKKISKGCICRKKKPTTKKHTPAPLYSPPLISVVHITEFAKNETTFCDSKYCDEIKYYLICFSFYILNFRWV